MKTGEKIRILRAIQGLSQQNMADMIGISRLAFGEIERGKTNPSPARIAQIAEKLGVSIIDIETFDHIILSFLGGTNQHNFVANSSNNPNKNPDIRELRYQIEKMQLEIKLLKSEKERADIEVHYWQEKSKQTTK